MTLFKLYFYGIIAKEEWNWNVEWAFKQILTERWWIIIHFLGSAQFVSRKFISPLQNFLENIWDHMVWDRVGRNFQYAGEINCRDINVARSILLHWTVINDNE